VPETNDRESRAPAPASVFDADPFDRPLVMLRRPARTVSVDGVRLTALEVRPVFLTRRTI